MTEVVSPAPGRRKSPRWILPAGLAALVAAGLVGALVASGSSRPAGPAASAQGASAPTPPIPAFPFTKEVALQRMEAVFPQIDSGEDIWGPLVTDGFGHSRHQIYFAEGAPDQVVNAYVDDAGRLSVVELSLDPAPPYAFMEPGEYARPILAAVAPDLSEANRVAALQTIAGAVQRHEVVDVLVPGASITVHATSTALVLTARPAR